MRSLLLLTCALLYLCTATDLSPDTDDADVVQLSDDNFDELTGEGTWLIQFYAPWCGHCKKLKPIFEQTAAALRGKVNLGSIDCTENKNVCSRFEVRSFPTLKFWRDGVARPFRGDRTKASMVKHGREMSKPPVELVNPATIQRSVKDVSFLLLETADEENEQALAVFERIARQLQGNHRFLRSGPGNRKGFPVESEGPVVVALSQGIDDPEFSGPWLETTLNVFVNQHKLPLVSELDGSNFEDIVSDGRLIIFSATNPSKELSRPYLDTMRNAAKRNRDLIFANIDGVRHAKYIEQFGITQAKLPTAFGLNYNEEFFYVTDDGSRVASEQQLSKFVQGIKTGTIRARATSSWYSPMRYYKMFEKWLGTFSEEQLVFWVTACMLIFGVFTAVVCCYAARDFTEPDAAAVKKAKSDKAQ